MTLQLLNSLVHWIIQHIMGFAKSIFNISHYIDMNFVRPCIMTNDTKDRGRTGNHELLRFALRRPYFAYLELLGSCRDTPFALLISA